MKSPIIFTIAALALGLAIPVSRAQDTGTPPPPPPPAAAGEHGEHHKGPHGDGLKFLTQKLSLTPDQQVKVKAILDDRKTAVDAVRNDASLDKKAKWPKIREIMQSHHDQIRALLTPDQQKKFDELREEHGRGPGGPGGPGGPAAPEAPKQ